MNARITRNALSIEDVTAIVATYNRPGPLEDLIKTFKERYPSLKIIAVDSSENPILRNDITHITTGKETGISAQRNRALEKVKTSLFLLLDDDHLCVQQTHLEKLINNVANGTHSVLGGAIYNIGVEQFDFHGEYEIVNNTLFHYVDPPDHTTSTYDTIGNFFVAETGTIRETGGWDANLKYAREHDDFFLTLKKKKIHVGYDASVGVEHMNYPKHHGGNKSLPCINHFLSKRDIQNKVEIRLIQKPTGEQYISRYNCIDKNSQPTHDTTDNIIGKYGNYPIIVS